MSYDVIIRKLPGKAEISRETYSDLGTALDEANYVGFGPSPVEITVVAADGEIHLTRVLGAEIS